jgi:hypothetical protein
MTPEDPVVAEIRAVRQELAERFGDDVNALCDFLTQRENDHPERLVNRPPRSPESIRVSAR